MLAAVAGSWLFYYKGTLPDNDAISQDITERLLTIDGYDSKVSEYALRSRFNLDSNYDRLARSSSLLDKSIEEMKNTYFLEMDVVNNVLHKKFQEYKNEIEIKKDLIENFKSHNSVLRNSEKYAPMAGQELMAIAEKENLLESVKLYNDVIKELLQYSLLDEITSKERLKLLMPKLNQSEKKMPEYSLTASIEFINHVNTVIAEKDMTDNYLSKALASTSDTSLASLSKAWKNWLNESNKTIENFNKYVFWYIAFLLVSIAYIIWNLVSLYKSLDQQVIERTNEVRVAFEELKNSEKELNKSQEMASLGKMAAGVAEEINTPLDYVSNNVDTIRLNMGDLDEILKCIALISDEFQKKSDERRNLPKIIKNMVLAYRSLRKRETISEIEGLLKGSSYGLNEISELVSSLKDFSRLDKANIKTANIHTNLDESISLCSNLLVQREIIRKYSEEMPLIECQASKINQVFINIISNAAKATSNDKGVIHIETGFTDGFAIIEISDNGVGINEESMLHIFEPFYTTHDIGEGAGLGLSISQKIMRSHGGTITAESKVNSGTKIVINLPIKQSVPILSVVNK